MRIGVVFPQTEIGGDVGAVRAYAAAVTELGFHHVLVYDHVVGADPSHHAGWSGPYDIHTTFHEPMVLYGFLAGVTPLASRQRSNKNADGAQRIFKKPGGRLVGQPVIELRLGFTLGLDTARVGKLHNQFALLTADIARSPGHLNERDEVQQLHCLRRVTQFLQRFNHFLIMNARGFFHLIALFFVCQFAVQLFDQFALFAHEILFFQTALAFGEDVFGGHGRSSPMK